MNKVWVITGAGRGMGLHIARAALAAGHQVVATGRDTDKVARAVGQSDKLLVVKLDVTSAVDAETAAKATIERFGRIDVLVNNAASFYAGFFEELSPRQMDLQLATSLVGPMNVTRAFLPVMRKQGSGKVISISSTAGLVGYEFCTAYSASKFGLDGWMEALQIEVSPFGIETMIVNPGFFRTELLTEESTQYADLAVEDYSRRRAQQEAFWTGANGTQGGDPAKLAQALIALDKEAELPRRFLAGADAIATAEQKIAILQQQIEAYRALSSSLAIDE
ncbi:SDR family oxidoreductase [Mesorhizobium sp. AR07]|uniref:SDR family oxidoreductase n=1 Tax=Mesorhizobium sp. AR07 TaxID=2865838 RepID=UPI002160F917|nr:SDR family oxidoreductase [Mesorhizobium sp. AR07]UVK46437.1 SDR family oxidoreductase [Mesorhizobium sp. AR07]